MTVRRIEMHGPRVTIRKADHSRGDHVALRIQSSVNHVIVPEGSHATAGAELDKVAAASLYFSRPVLPRRAVRCVGTLPRKQRQSDAGHSYRSPPTTGLQDPFPDSGASAPRRPLDLG